MPSDKFEDQMDRLLRRLDRQNELLEFVVTELVKANTFRERSDKRSDGINPNN